MDMDMDAEYTGGYNVNFNEVLKHTKSLAITRMLAKDIMANPYMALGDFFKSVSDSDLKTLCAIAEDNEHDNFEDLILMAMMLASAEGVESPADFDGVRALVAQFTGYLIIESLSRKGLVKVYHENMSFGDEFGDKIVVEKI